MHYFFFHLSTAIKREEAKVQRSLKEAAKKGDKDVCRVLAKEIVNSRKAVKKLYAAKATMNSVSMQMKNQASKFNRWWLLNFTNVEDFYTDYVLLRNTLPIVV